jgi:ribosome-binding protein aMBF1 (putative translation factor)
VLLGYGSLNESDIREGIRRLAVVLDAAMGGLSQVGAAFAELVRKHRTRKGLSQEALAEAAGIHHTYVGLLERGERKPTIDVAERVARALGCKLSALIAEAERATLRR